MIDIEEIRDEITKLEHSDTTYSNCSKLAVLYSVVNNFDRQNKTIERPSSASYSFGGSEFLTECSKADIAHVLAVMDEHMDCIRLLYPKEYSKILRKIREK